MSWSRMTKAGINWKGEGDIVADECETQVGYLRAEQDTMQENDACQN